MRRQLAGIKGKVLGLRKATSTYNFTPAVGFRISPCHLITILVLIHYLAWAQDASTGALRGSVLDAQGAAVTKADIVAICVETGVRYHTGTDVAGRFVMDLLPPGNYSARAEAEGMSPQVSPVIRVEVGAAQQLTFKLTVAGPKETVTVSGAPPAVQTNPTAVSSVIDEQAIASIPLNGRRFTDLLLLTPGVTQDPRALTSGSNGDLSYGGIRGYNTSYWWTGRTTTMDSSRRRADDIARRISFRTKWWRSSASRRTATVRNRDGRRARS